MHVPVQTSHIFAVLSNDAVINLSPSVLKSCLAQGCAEKDVMHAVAPEGGVRARKEGVAVTTNALIIAALSHSQAPSNAHSTSDVLVQFVRDAN